MHRKRRGRRETGASLINTVWLIGTTSTEVRYVTIGSTSSMSIAGQRVTRRQCKACQLKHRGRGDVGQALSIFAVSCEWKSFRAQTKGWVKLCGHCPDATIQPETRRPHSRSRSWPHPPTARDWGLRCICRRRLNESHRRIPPYYPQPLPIYPSK